MARTKQTARRPGFPYKKPTASWSTLPALASRPRPALGDVGSAVTNSSNNARASSDTISSASASDKASKEGKLNQQQKETNSNADENGDLNDIGSKENNNDPQPGPSGMDVDATMEEETIEPKPNEDYNDDDDDIPMPLQDGNVGDDDADDGLPALLEGTEDAGDVGILAESSTTNNHDDVEDEDDDDEDDDEEEEPTTRFDVYQTLKRVSFPGSIASSGCADDILPSLPGLTIGGCPVSLPLTDAAAKTLLKRSSVAWPVRDPTYRNTYRVPADKIAFGNHSWEGGMDDLLDTVCIRLGMERSRITAKLDMMFVMEAGAKVEKRKDENEMAADEVLGTLLVQLPSVFTGGTIRIRHEYEYVEEEEEEEDDEEDTDDDDDEDVVDEATLLRAVDLIYIAVEDEASLTAKDIIRSLERDHEFQLNQDRKDLVEERLSDLVAGDVLPQIEERRDNSSGDQPSRGLLLRAVNLLYFATCTDGTGSFGVNEVCQSIQDAHQITLDQGSKEIITNQVAGIIAGTVLPTLDDDFSDASVAMSEAGNTSTEDGGDDDEKEEEEEEKDMMMMREEKMQFTLGAGDDSAFGCRFMCYYSGCEFSMKQILTGRRVMLAYSLCYGADDDEVGDEENSKEKEVATTDEKSLKPNATLVCSSMVPLQRSLALLPRANRIFLRPLSFNYDNTILANHAIEALEDSDRRIAEGLKVAMGQDWRLFIVEARLVHKRITGYYGDILESDYLPGDLLKVFDEDGDEMEDETEDWIGSILEFASCEVDDNGAILCREMGDAFNTGCDCGACGRNFLPKDYTIDDVWGEGDCVTSDCGEYDDKRKKETTWSSNFLLAYDESSEFELMALGGKIAMEDAVDDVVCSWDASLLKRLVQAIQLKGSKCALPLSSCRTLLSTILGEDEDSEEDRLVPDKKDMVSFVPTVLRNLCSEDEPDEDLYKLVLSAIEKLGWHNLVEPIATLMKKKAKLQTLKLPQFLSRVEFIFKAEANSSCTTDELRTFLDLSCYDFSQSPNYKKHPRAANKSDSVATSVIYEKLEGWVKERGWELMEGVAQVTFSACANIDEQQNNDYQEELKGLMKRCEALLRLYSGNPSGRTEIKKLLCDAASDIVRKIERPGKFHILASEEWMCMLLKRLLFRFGSQTIFDRFGKCLVKDEGALLTVLKYLGDHPNQFYQIHRDILNKCLVQHSINGEWKKEAADEFRSSSLHIRRVLSSYPRIACEKDFVGRLPLHWSTDCDGPKVDNVTDIFNSNTKDCSVADPITGLFPFMLAAKQECTDTATQGGSQPCQWRHPTGDQEEKEERGNGGIQRQILAGGHSGEKAISEID